MSVPLRTALNRTVSIYFLVVGLDGGDQSAVVAAERHSDSRTEEVTQAVGHLSHRDVEDVGKRDRHFAVVARQYQPSLAQEDPPLDGVGTGRHLGVERADEVCDD